MGCSYDFGCKTCRKAYYLGSSSYSSWLTFETAKDYDEAAGLHHRDGRDLKLYRINQGIRRLLGEHDGYEHFYALSDITHRHGKVLCQLEREAEKA